MSSFAWIFALLTIVGVINVAHSHNFGKCVTPDGIKGDCIYLTSCPALQKIYEKRPVTLQDRQFLSVRQCGFRDKYPLVCCLETETITTPKPALKIIFPKAIITESQPSSILPSLLPKPGVCGSYEEDYIYRGNETMINEYPWMVLLKYSKPYEKPGFHCGGSLINKRYVLTASHCVNGRDIPRRWSLIAVRLGEWDLTSPTDCEKFVDEEICNDPTVDISIELKIPHENYDPYSTNLLNDIALLRLSRDVEYTRSVQPICLPFVNRFRGGNFVNQTLSVAGWGQTESRSSSTRKLKVNIDGTSNAVCQKKYKIKNVEIHESQICAGGDLGYDSCRGDSGGPLMRLNEQGNPPHWVIIGLVSFGAVPCGQSGWPGVHTKVGYFLPWIEANIKP